MSEFSTSFHIRTTDSKGAEKAIQKAKYSGLVFGPKNGWLTFVPFADSNGYDSIGDPVEFAFALAQVTALPILQYSYAEDHMWSFTFLRTDQPPSIFVFGWDPEPECLLDHLDLSAFDGIVPQSKVEPFLKEQRYDDSGAPLAYGFAEMLGLPAYRWLSPDLVQSNTEDFLGEGGRRIGRKRPAPEERLKLPPPTKVHVPKIDLSAREAMELLKPMTASLEADWILHELHGHAHLHLEDPAKANDRSDWQFRYKNTRTRDMIYAYLYSNGNAGFKYLSKDMPDDAHELSPEMTKTLIDEYRKSPGMAELVQALDSGLLKLPLPRNMKLPENWLDSMRIAEIVATIPPPREMPQSQLRMLSLMWTFRPEARWLVSRSPDDFNAEYRNWSIELDAVTGKVLYETLGACAKGDYIIRTVRERVRGGEWQDIAVVAPQSRR